jgi:DNA-binding NtrC family response regulator
MVTLAIETSGGSELTYQLGKKVISIGASSQNDVVIRAPGVAPRHLVIQHNGRVFTFLGQNRQVVVLNGERRSRGVLRVGDRVRIGTATLVFKGLGDGETEVELIEARDDDAFAERQAAAPALSSKPRAEVVLYSEPQRLAEARNRLVEIFRLGVRSDLVPSLRTYFGSVFKDRQALLAWLDEDGRFQPIVSQWSGEIPKLPERTFEELASSGRFALLRLGTRELLIFPVGRDTGLGSRAYLIVETLREDQDDDGTLLAELARVLAIHWERVESSSSLYGPWETASRKRIEDHLPGTSQAVQVLRDNVLEAARSPYPALLCGRQGSGRVFVGSMIASMHPTGELPIRIIQARGGDDDGFRLELLGPVAEDEPERGLLEHLKGQVVVLRDIHHLSPPLQREIAALIGHDVQSGYGPVVRWIATTVADCMALLSEGQFDSALFNLFQRHIVRIPSLADRREDLPLLIVRLLDMVGAEQGKQVRGVELETLNSLLSYSFDGEMVELISELRRLVSATPDGEMVRGIVPALLRRSGSSEEGATVMSASLLAQDDLKTVVPAVERMVIDRVLRRTYGNQSKAARILNLSRGALIAKMKDYDVPDYRYLRRGH